MKTKNFLLADKVELDGASGFNFTLCLGLKNPKAVCEKEYDKIPTWKELADDLIEFCEEENICLSYLAEQGTIQQGETRSRLAPCAVERIANHLMQHA